MDATEKTDVNAICLQNAVLCADCEVISDSAHETCRVCGSRSLLSLSRVLGGTLPVQRAQLVDAWDSNYGSPALPRRLRLVRRASA
jgi:hypothetical protein